MAISGYENLAGANFMQRQIRQMCRGSADQALGDGTTARRLSWSESKSHGLGPTMGTPLPESALNSFDIATLLAEHPTSKVIYFDAVVTARLVKGRTSDALRLAMSDGDRHKLLWLRRDPALTCRSAMVAEPFGARCRRPVRAPWAALRCRLHKRVVERQLIGAEIGSDAAPVPE
ncbi:hypothetical protein [Micromonospora humi]|uniref:hypothetical protein n=1 Tax=Micromonospora humi TaxID=745366 RepID=UPI0015866142|nr:hypothetical protein [Micromonospora humi]